MDVGGGRSLSAATARRRCRAVRDPKVLCAIAARRYPWQDAAAICLGCAFVGRVTERREGLPAKPISPQIRIEQGGATGRWIGEVRCAATSGWDRRDFFQAAAAAGLAAAAPRAASAAPRGRRSYVPKSMSHYVQNTGDVPLKFLEPFRSPRFEDVSLNQWLALTPAQLVKSHLGLDQSTFDH